MTPGEVGFLQERMVRLDERIEVVEAELRMLKELRRRRALEFTTQVGGEMP